MQFRTKNTFYLRISANAVVPLCLYLDDKNVEWMSEYILNLLLEDLRQAFNSLDEGAQLREGLTGKKTDVTIRKQDMYQFAYFFRKGQPHSVIFKTRKFVEEKAPENKGKAPEQPIEINDDDEEAVEEGEEEKPKLKMQVSYKGLTVTERCLCIIIEPRTGDTATTGSLRQRTLEETVVSATQRQKTVEPGPTLSSFPEQTRQQQRERTPLFLPDLDFERSTPAPFPMTASVIQRSIGELDSLRGRGEDEDEDDALHAFGQTLNSIGDVIAGDIDDYDDEEGDAFLGDADERKEAL